MLYLVILIVSLLIIAITIYLLQSGYIAVRYLRDGWEDELELRFSTAGGLIVLDFYVPFTDPGTDGYKLIRKTKKEQEKEKERVKEQNKAIPAEISLNERILGLYNRFKFLKDSGSEQDDKTDKIYKYLFGKLRMKEIKLDITAGTGDAFYTGILNGVIWTVSGAFISYILNRYNPPEKYIKINPDYLAKTIKIDFHCIFSIKNVHIIVVGIRYLIKR